MRGCLSKEVALTFNVSIVFCFCEKSIKVWNCFNLSKCCSICLILTRKKESSLAVIPTFYSQKDKKMKWLWADLNIETDSRLSLTFTYAYLLACINALYIYLSLTRFYFYFSLMLELPTSISLSLSHLHQYDCICSLILLWWWLLYCYIVCVQYFSIIMPSSLYFFASLRFLVFYDKCNSCNNQVFSFIE